MKGTLALFGLFLIFAGISFAVEETDYNHYCYRVCCLGSDATYVEGPPQQCIGQGPSLDTYVQNCVDQCLHELGSYYEANPNPAYVTVDQVEMGVVYDPETGAVQETNASLQNEDIQPDAVNEGNLGQPLVEEGTSTGSTGSTPSGSAPLPPKSGGLCPLGFLLLVPLFFSMRK
jgi:hypothetical protein